MGDASSSDLVNETVTFVVPYLCKGVALNGRYVDDWSSLRGANVEIWQQGALVCAGTVDAVTEDGAILWLWSLTTGRRLYEKAAFYEVWAAEERGGSTIR